MSTRTVGPKTDPGCCLPDARGRQPCRHRSIPLTDGRRPTGPSPIDRGSGQRDLPPTGRPQTHGRGAVADVPGTGRTATTTCCTDRARRLRRPLSAGGTDHRRRGQRRPGRCHRAHATGRVGGRRTSTVRCRSGNVSDDLLVRATGPHRSASGSTRASSSNPAEAAFGTVPTSSWPRCRISNGPNRPGPQSLPAQGGCRVPRAMRHRTPCSPGCWRDGPEARPGHGGGAGCAAVAGRS